MDQLVITAIPFFLLALGLEALALRHAAKENAEERRHLGYKLQDTETSLMMGIGHLVVGGLWKVVPLAGVAAIYEVSPFHLPTDEWWTYVALFFADDLAFYCFHRSHHRVRILWATHVVHHSSEHFNLSTALRQDWSPFTVAIFWLPSALFFPPWMIFLALSWSLLYQFGLHTEAIGTLPRPIEFVFNTPSHHRVHHGSQHQYLDRNYGGILIIWDRLFGTFEPEGERVRYGLTTNIDTYNPVRVAYGEWLALLRDMRRARTWRESIGYAVHGPGWRPAGAPEPTPPVVEPSPAAAPMPTAAETV